MFETISNEQLAAVNGGGGGGGDAASDQWKKTKQDFASAGRRGQQAQVAEVQAASKILTGDYSGAARSVGKVLEYSAAAAYDTVHGVTSAIGDLIPQLGIP